MKANELRVGNIVNDHLGRTLQVVGFKDDNVYLLLSNGEKVRYNIKTVQPTPLTEDWLLKFGFIYNNWNYDLGRFTFHAQGKDDNGAFYNTEFYIMRNSTKSLILLSYQIEHVHQLQNLYFALTGEELTVKL